jgi:hypothetical protein
VVSNLQGPDPCSQKLLAAVGRLGRPAALPSAGSSTLDFDINTDPLTIEFLFILFLFNWSHQASSDYFPELLVTLRPITPTLGNRNIRHFIIWPSYYCYWTAPPTRRHVVCVGCQGWFHLRCSPPRILTDQCRFH